MAPTHSTVTQKRTQSRGPLTDACIVKMTRRQQEHLRAGVGVDDALVILCRAVQEVTCCRDAGEHLLCGLHEGLDDGLAQLPQQEALQGKEKRCIWQRLLDSAFMPTNNLSGCLLSNIGELQQPKTWPMHSPAALNLENMIASNGHALTSTVACAVALVARPARPFCRTGLVMTPLRPLLPVAPSSSRVSTDSTKFWSFMKGSAPARWG